MPTHRMPAVDLPRDELQHRRFEHEWWYFFAVLRGSTGARYHYTTALMRRGVAWVSYLRWWAEGRPPLIKREFHGWPPVPSNTDLVIAPTENWRVRLGAGRSTHRLGAIADLHFADDKVGAFLHTRASDGGIRNYGGENEMAWYSWPRLKVTGSLAGARGDAARVEGFGWMEHQWGNTDFTKLSWRYVPILLESPSPRVLIAFHYQHEDEDDETIEVAELVDGEARPVPSATLDPIGPGGSLTRVLGGGLDLRCRTQGTGIVDLGFPGVPRFVEAPSIVYDASDAPIGVAMTEYHPVP